MGKRDQGRLVHEIRDALLAHGFLPTRVTEVVTADDQLKGIRHPGFTVQKHNDGRAVRVGYRLAARSNKSGSDWAVIQAHGEARMRKLISFNRALEEAGFVCTGINSRDPFFPYSIWMRGLSTEAKRIEPDDPDFRG